MSSRSSVATRGTAKNTVLFGAMCLIWGLTWIALKAGLATVPPFFFLGTRFAAAGAALFGYMAVNRESMVVRPRDWLRFCLVTALLISCCYGLLAWGMLFINSGTAAMLELSFSPVALLLFALMFREESFSLGRALAIALGIAGLALLFAPKIAFGADHQSALGAAAVVAAAVVYALGSVLSRPLLRTYSTRLVAATTTFWGGALLVGASLVLETGSREALRGAWGLAAWCGWAFLVVFGSLAGFTIYLRLLDRWGASKAGSFAFVSPVIAVVAGALVYREQVSLIDMAGMTVMLAAAWLAIRSRTPHVKGRLGDTVRYRERSFRQIPFR